MKTYRLIKKYPSSPELGTEVSLFYGDGYNTIDNFFTYRLSKSNVEGYPEYWEEVKQTDYEILMWSYGRNKDLFSRDPDWTAGEYHIHTVKRLSDKKVFTVGQQVEGAIKKGKIDKIIIAENLNIDVAGYYSSPEYQDKVFLCIDNTIGNIPLEEAKHTKPALFISKDGKEIFEGDKIFSIENKPYLIDTILCLTASDKTEELFPRRIFFSNQEAAKDYIWQNKPCLSFNEIAPIIGQCNETTYINLDKLTEKLKALIISKIIK